MHSFDKIKPGIQYVGKEEIVAPGIEKVHGIDHYQLDGCPVTVTVDGGLAMIYDLKFPAQKIHHVLFLNLKDNGDVFIEACA